MAFVTQRERHLLVLDQPVFTRPTGHAPSGDVEIDLRLIEREAGFISEHLFAHHANAFDLSELLARSARAVQHLADQLLRLRRELPARRGEGRQDRNRRAGALKQVVAKLEAIEGYVIRLPYH